MQILDLKLRFQQHISFGNGFKDTGRRRPLLRPQWGNFQKCLLCNDNRIPFCSHPFLSRHLQNRQKVASSNLVRAAKLYSAATWACLVVQFLLHYFSDLLGFESNYKYYCALILQTNSRWRLFFPPLSQENKSLSAEYQPLWFDIQ